ncbi:hypothetical protein [Rheinheimera hassiensis]|uniref:hypothetical protein n=1 Tax=Rheinheimera hassiensis TaxID=1193627 RepID=UPI001F053408|nr:hypothetical protein [Rheinheimera hassiensis]
MRAVDQRMQSLLAACHLAKFGMNENLLNIYYPLDKGMYKQYYAGPADGQKRQRVSEGWMRGKEAYLIVRAHRIFIHLFPGNEDYSRLISVTDLWCFFQAYVTLYPQDNMTPNRMHYMIEKVRARRLRIMKECCSCGKPFLLHEEEFTWLPCAVCEITKTALTAQNAQQIKAAK